jgi:hypothetical protein
MMDVQLRAQDVRSETVSLYCDDQAGPPEKYIVTVDMLRFFDAGLFGAELEFREGQMPDTTPILTGDKKNLLFDKGLPDPLRGGIFDWAHDMYDAIRNKMDKEGT